MHPIESVSATTFARKVATYLDHVRFTGETIAITKGTHIVAELVPSKPAGLPISELANLIAEAPKLGNSAHSMAKDLKKNRRTHRNKLENPWD
jgi:antitoxin (DNA-binding transcriptional repressor) of toxin-antitoxin stability system